MRQESSDNQNDTYIKFAQHQNSKETFFFMNLYFPGCRAGGPAGGRAGSPAGGRRRVGRVGGRASGRLETGVRGYITAPLRG